MEKQPEKPIEKAPEPEVKREPEPEPEVDEAPSENKILVANKPAANIKSLSLEDVDKLMEKNLRKFGKMGSRKKPSKPEIGVEKDYRSIFTKFLVLGGLGLFLLKRS